MKAAALPVLVNPLSGAGFTAQDRTHIETLFRENGAEPAFRLSSDVRAAALAVAKERPPCIIAAGGDGTVSAVARGSVDRRNAGSAPASRKSPSIWLRSCAVKPPPESGLTRTGSGEAFTPSMRRSSRSP